MLANPLAHCVRALAMAVAFASSATLGQPAPASAAAQPITPDTVLIENGVVKVTKRDFDLEVARLAAEARGSVVNSQRKIAEIVGRLLVMKTLAHEARTQGLDRDPDVTAKLGLETDRFYAQVRQSKIEEQAANEFDAKRAQWEARAREVYAADRKRFVAAEQVSASHILFSVQQHSSDEARKLVDEARARIAAGANFNDVAKAVSEDPTAKQNGGSIGFFTRSEVHPAFGAAAFALKSVGDVSEPVLTSFGWHLIKLEARRPSAEKSFDQVREQILLELKQKYVNDRRDTLLGAVGSDPAVKPNAGALEALYQRAPDADTLRRALPDGAPASSSAPR